VSVLQSIRRGLPKRYNARSPSVDAPLLDRADLQRLQTSAHTLRIPLPQNRLQSAHNLLGERLSFYRGKGYEFEENRAYQIGDEPRLINWRLYARTGDLYTKVFNEERHPEVCIVLDRRATMRFGTREQLKVVQAAKIAAYYFYQAQQQAFPISGVVINETMEWCSPSSGQSSSSAFLQELLAPCPPLDFSTTQPEFNDLLHLLIEKLPAGSIVILISDFSDMVGHDAITLLNQLAQQHELMALRIMDPVERELPAGTDILIDDPGADDPIRVDGRDQEKLSSYAMAVRQRDQRLITSLQQIGVSLHTCSTRVDPVEWINSLHGVQRTD
jgi:uncharacterized protein (DUF58 family)